MRHSFCHCLFLTSPSFGALGKLCFVILYFQCLRKCFLRRNRSYFGSDLDCCFCIASFGKDEIR